MERLHAKYYVWVDHNDVNKAIDYIIESAKSVGVEVIPCKTALSMQFMEKVMHGLRERAEQIRAEIAEDLVNAENESKRTQDDTDCGITIGLQMALNVIDKHTKQD